MQNALTGLLGFLMLFGSPSPQERPREVKGAGHLLGETAERFFSEDAVGELLLACQAKDWKAVKQMAKAVDRASKPNAQVICSNAALVKQQAISGARQDYGGGDDKAMRTDIFTLDGGHLVKIDMVFNVSTTDVDGYHPKYFAELLEGLQEAYGQPSRSYSETVFDVYGIKYDAHRAEWIGNQDVITIIEQPGRNGRTEIIVETLAERNRATKAPKAANPLQ